MGGQAGSEQIPVFVEVEKKATSDDKSSPIKQINATSLPATYMSVVFSFHLLFPPFQPRNRFYLETRGMLLVTVRKFHISWNGRTFTEFSRRWE
jgi:hypothetical protein